MASRSSYHHVTQNNGLWTGYDTFYDADAPTDHQERSDLYYGYFEYANTYAYGAYDLSCLPEVFDYDPNDAFYYGYSSFGDYLWNRVFSIGTDYYGSTYITDLNDQVIKDQRCGVVVEPGNSDAREYYAYVNLDSVLTPSDYQAVAELIWGDSYAGDDWVVIDEYIFRGFCGDECVPLKMTVFPDSENPVTFDLTYNRDTLQENETVLTETLEFEDAFRAFRVQDQYYAGGDERFMDWVAEKQQHPIGGGFEENEVGFGTNHTQYCYYETNHLKVYHYTEYNGTHSMTRTFVVLEGLFTIVMLPVIIALTVWMFIEKRKR